MEIVYLFVIGAAVAAFVSYPFWGRGDVTPTEDPEVAGLEAARESKYREIRDAETDLASGKLTQADFDRVNADLRRDAVDILDQLEDAKRDSPLASVAPPEEDPVDEPATEDGDDSPPKTADS